MFTKTLTELNQPISHQTFYPMGTLTCLRTSPLMQFQQDTARRFSFGALLGIYIFKEL
jgi:hypothetical protein